MNMKIKVQIGHFSSTTTAEVTTGLRQGHALSPILFNIILEKVRQNCGYGQRGIQFSEKKEGLLVYADDLVLLVENK